MDETYIKVKDRWKYAYQAVGKQEYGWFFITRQSNKYLNNIVEQSHQKAKGKRQKAKGINV